MSKREVSCSLLSPGVLIVSALTRFLVVDLAPQAADDRIDRALSDVRVFAPHVLQERRPAVNDSWTRGDFLDTSTGGMFKSSP